MKSSWAYNNGKRQLKEVASKDAPLTGWIKIGKIEAGDLLRYAERGKHDRSKLVVKTYANKTQALQKIKDLQNNGINCWMRLNYPFVIEAIDIKLKDVTNSDIVRKSDGVTVIEDCWQEGVKNTEAEKEETR